LRTTSGEEYTYDLYSMRRRPGEEYMTKSAQEQDKHEYRFDINICGSVNCRTSRIKEYNHEDKPAACQQWVDGNTAYETALGIYDTMEVREGVDPKMGFTLIFGNGDLCHNKYNRSAVIDVVCAAEMTTEYQLDYRFVDEGCAYFFTLRSIQGCPLAAPPGPSTTAELPTPSSTSPVTVFFLLVLVIGAVYFIGGTAYGKFVQNKEGLDALPHKDMWIQVITCCGRVKGGGGSGSAGISAVGRSREGFNVYNDGI